MQVITHPLYSTTTFNNDIALLKLASPVVFTPRISPVCLAPSTINILPGTRCFTTGWGRTATTCESPVRQRRIAKIYSCILYFYPSHDSKQPIWNLLLFSASPLILQQTGVPITNPAVCRQIWAPSKMLITDAMICAGASGSSSCQVYEDRHKHIPISMLLLFQSQMCVCVCFPQGDSGGPLVCESSGVWSLVGSVSWGTSTCDTRYPGVYARISQLRSWIDKTIASN